MKIKVLSILSLFIVLSSSCWGDTYDQKKLSDASEGLLKKGLPEIAKKVAIIITVGSLSAKAQAKYDKIEGKENNTALENASIVVDSMYNEEKEKIGAIASDAEIIYTFGVKPSAKIAMGTTLEKTKEFRDYYESDIEPELEKEYDRLVPIVSEKFKESRDYASKKWEESEPEIKKHYDTLKNTISENISGFLK